MPSTPMDGPNTLVVEVERIDDRIVVGRERNTRATVRFVPSPRTAERVRLALDEGRGIVVSVEANAPGVLAVDPA